MTAAPLKSLTLTAFRGASETFKLDFEPKKKLTIVYGENGTGKTTICDAFEILAKGEAGSLKDKGIDATRHKYLNSAKKKPEDLSVSLETAQGAACMGRLSGKNVVVTPEIGRPRLAIMRRKQMLEFVEATPGDRYKAIAGFIDIATFEQSEGNLKKLVGDLESEKADAGKEVLGSYTAIADVYASAGNAPGQNPVDWAAALLAQPEGNEAQEQAAIDMLVVQYQALAAYPDQLQARQSAVATAQSEFDIAQGEMAVSASTATASANELVAVLEAGQHYLETHSDNDVCPLCESGDRAAGLAISIKDRLNQFGAVREAKTKLDKCRLTLEQAQANLDHLQISYAENMSGYQSARTGFAWDQKYSFPESLPPQAIADLQAWLDANNDLHGKWKDIEASLRQGKERRENAGRALQRYNDNTAKVAELGALRAMTQQQPLDPQAIVGKAGVVLEALLNFVAERYGCRLPFKPNGKHTLGELLPNVKGKLRDALHIEIVESDGMAVTIKDKIQFKPILDEISGIVTVRNEVGAHYNIDGFDVPDAKALAFANHVMALADAMICPEHGWPTSSKSGSHWANSGGTRRMHPLKEPQ